ncbi:hypothetical protein ACHAXR_012102 [Thalassiosira sp. AJA248-18]
MNGGHHSNRFSRSPYAVLNLPPSSGENNQPISDDKVRDSYKRLSRLLHPDKRPPGKEREDAQEIFIELQHAYETLVDPALRQAYDHYGHYAVAHVRNNKYQADSLYRCLTSLHDDGKPSEALELLQIVLEDTERKKRQKEWEFNADVEVNMHPCNPEEAASGSFMEWAEVSSTNVSLTASVPMPPQTNASPFPAQSSGGNQSQAAARRRQKMQLSIGGQSSLENGMGSTRGIISANYQPVAHTNVSSDLTVGHKHIESSVSSSTQLANGTGLSAKMTRQYELGSNKEGNLAFGFSSQRNLTMFHGRNVHAMFALGVGSNLKMNYGVLSLTTWGFNIADQNESDSPPPRINAKITIGSPFPIQCSVDQPHLFGASHRSGRASVAWSPLQGYKLKGVMSRKIMKTCDFHESEFPSNLDIEVEHTGLSGLKWLIRYERPEGLTIRIPIFVSSFLSPVYWNKVLWVSTLSFLLDETIEELMGHSTSKSETKAGDTNIHKTISTKIRTNQNEQQWLGSSKAKRDAERQLSIIAPIAKMKRQREESINGLVILKATYASVSSLPSGTIPNTALDVTEQLQFWVEQSRLYLPPSSKSLLLGFYDLIGSKVNRVGDTANDISPLSEFTHRWICIMNIWLSRLGVGVEDAAYQKDYTDNGGSNESVVLTVRYKYKGGVFEVRIGDDDVLELPSSDSTILGSSDLVS